MLPVEKVHIKSLDFLRAFACLSVCWYHFVYFTPDFLPADSWLRMSGMYGFLGVQVFFIISGFILPWSMHQGGYTFSNYPRFLAKRAVRIEPPYLITIVLTITVNYLATKSHLYRGAPFHVSLPQVLLHLGYLNTFFHYPWLNQSFWTLAIEFQYYVLVGFLFPWISNESRYKRWIIAALFLSSFLISKSHAFITAFGPLFLSGFIAFQYKVEIIKRAEFLFMLAVAIATTAFFIDAKYAIVILLCVPSLLLIKTENKTILFLGSISYSLYLLHPIIGQKVVNLSMNFVHSTTVKFAVALLAVICSSVAAYVLYLLVERPSLKFSKGIKYK
jgi:peptidoglycan/LPS O-acetylase OafA/YrhL